METSKFYLLLKNDKYFYYITDVIFVFVNAGREKTVQMKKIYHSLFWLSRRKSGQTREGVFIMNIQMVQQSKCLFSKSSFSKSLADTWKDENSRK